MKSKACKHCGLTKETAKVAPHFSYCSKHNAPLCPYCGICLKEPANAVTKHEAALRIERNSA